MRQAHTGMPVFCREKLLLFEAGRTIEDRTAHPAEGFTRSKGGSRAVSVLLAGLQEERLGPLALLRNGRLSLAHAHMQISFPHRLPPSECLATIDALGVTVRHFTILSSLF
jgi:hypothetical protein